jgi:hypothetical protein
MRTVTAARYVLPLREGGSLPGLIEADDGKLYATKFRAAGQGAAALVAEVIGGELARTAGLRVPELVTLVIPPGFGLTDGDPEIHDLLVASAGDNLGLAFLSAALGFDPAAKEPVDPAFAALVVAFDVLISNVDRTVRNPNLLLCKGELFLIDHGAALYWQHAWDGGLGNPSAPLPRLTEHALWPYAGDLVAAARALVTALPDAAIAAAVGEVSASWVDDARRPQYVARLAARRDVLPAIMEAARG